MRSLAPLVLAHKAGAGGATGADLILKNAGLRIGPAASGRPCLAFAKLQVFGPGRHDGVWPASAPGAHCCDLRDQVP